MADVPILTIDEIAPYGIRSITLAKSCSEHIQEIFDILAPGGPPPQEKILKDVHNYDKFDSATMIYFTEWNAEWTTDNATLKADSIDDEFSSSTTNMKVNLVFTAGETAFQLFCDSVVGSTLYRGSYTYDLNMRYAKLRAKGVTREQITKLAKLLCFPPDLPVEPIA